MTIKELKLAIQDLPDHMDVFIRQTNEEYSFSLAEKTVTEPVVFHEEHIPKKQ